MDHPRAPAAIPPPLPTLDHRGRKVWVFTGRLDRDLAAGWWHPLLDAAARETGETVADLSGVDYIDGAGLALLLQWRETAASAGGRLEIEGLAEETRRLLDAAIEGLTRSPGSDPPSPSLVQAVGEKAAGFADEVKDLIVFTGELALTLARAAFRPGSIRWRDALAAMESTGVNALGIVALIGFLVGLIMSFQAAVPMRMFGAEIYVADLIALSMVRELGPLMTAIVLCGRSGSAFAAELGTMTINEEVNALVTLGLEPVRFLVVPRVIAAVAMTPILTIFSDLIGMVGGALVLGILGHPLMAYLHQVQSAIDYGDVLGGLAKSFVFGVLIAAVGCHRGLQTGAGPSAVGDATTRAVVSGIVLIVIVDGLFSVVYFALDL